MLSGGATVAGAVGGLGGTGVKLATDVDDVVGASVVDVVLVALVVELSDPPPQVCEMIAAPLTVYEGLAEFRWGG